MSSWIVSCPRCHKDIYTARVEPVRGMPLRRKDFKHMDGRPVGRDDLYGCRYCGCSFLEKAPVPGSDTREVTHAPE